MRIKNKLHYILKYLFLAFPFVELIFVMFVNQSQAGTTLINLVDLIDNGKLIFHQIGSFGFASEIGDIIINIFSLNVEIAYYFSGCIVWIMAVYYFDILVDALTLIPKIMHWLFEKLTMGDK